MPAKTIQLAVTITDLDDTDDVQGLMNDMVDRASTARVEVDLGYVFNGTITALTLVDAPYKPEGD